MPNWKKVVVSGSSAALSNLSVDNALTASGLIYPTVDGTSGQFLTTDGTGSLTFSDVSATDAEATHIPVKNTSGASIDKGTPVYITGNVGNSERLEIAPADASDTSKMPAVGLLETTLAADGEGYVVQGGYLRQLTTDTIDGTATTSNDTVYVKAGGGLTMTKPTGDTNYIQNIAKIARSHSSAGSVIVSSILRTNDVPNLPTGKIWVGSAANTVTSSVVHLDETNGRLGIGTTAPAAALDVNGDAFIQNDGSLIASGSGYLRTGNDNGGTVLIGGDGSISYIQSQNNRLVLQTSRAEDDIEFKVGESAATSSMFIDGANGRIGIGTTTPSADLDIEDATGVTIDVNSSSGDGLLRFQDAGVTKWFIGRDNTNQNFAFSSGSGLGNGNLLTLTTSGEVGVNTSSPAGVFEVVTQDSNRYIRFKAPNGEERFEFETGGSGNEARLYMYDNDGTTRNIQLVAGASATSYINGGNLGIGTASPSYKLDIDGDLRVLSSSISYQENIDVDSAAAETVATVTIADFDAAFFDYVIKSGTNLRAGTVTAVHDGTNVEYNEVSTQDLGDTSDVTLSVDISGADMRLRATTTSDNWEIKSLVRTI